MEAIVCCQETINLLHFYHTLNVVSTTRTPPTLSPGSLFHMPYVNRPLTMESDDGGGPRGCSRLMEKAESDVSVATC